MKYLLKHRCQDLMTGKVTVEYFERGGPIAPEKIDDYLIETFDEYEQDKLSFEAAKERIKVLFIFQLIEDEEFTPLMERIWRMEEKKELSRTCSNEASLSTKRL